MSDYNTESTASNDQIKTLKEEINKLKSEITKYKLVLKEYGIESLEDPNVSEEEWICVNEIGALKEISETRGLQDDEIKSLETLVKTLDKIRGDNKSSKKTIKGKKTDVGKLLEIARGE